MAWFFTIIWMKSKIVAGHLYAMMTAQRKLSISNNHSSPNPNLQKEPQIGSFTNDFTLFVTIKNMLKRIGKEQARMK